jgi:hypothetical protein
MGAISAAYDGAIQIIEHFHPGAPAGWDSKWGQIIVSADHAAGLRPRFTSSSTREASRFGQA